VGYGPGFFARSCKEVGSAGSVVGVDSSPAMLALAARRCEDRENVKLHEADAASFPDQRAVTHNAQFGAPSSVFRTTWTGTH